MAIERRTSTLGKIATSDGYGLVDGPFGSNLPASLYTPEGVPVIRGSNLSLGTSRFRSDEFVFVSEETAARLVRSLCKPDDIIFTKKGTLGQTGLIPRSGGFERYLLSSNQMKLTVDCSIADPLFVYYQVSSPDSVSKIIRDAESTGVPKTNVAYLRDFPIVLPALEEQRAIAHILGTLDDKIELNRRRNETLEAMARALFKDWFVDFGPVRAKMEGREPYLPADLWQLFPNRLDDDGKPEGWREVAAEAIADIGIGKTPPRKEHQWFSETDSDVRWVSIRDMGNSGVFLQHTSEYLTDVAIGKFNVRVVPDNTTILSFKLTVGRVAITDGEMATNEAIAHFKVFDQSGISTEYLYSYLREFDYGRLGSTSSIATAVNSKSIKALPVLIPENDVAHHFTCRASPFFTHIKQFQSEAVTLAQLRDTLLPKLISGELRVKDAERFIKERSA